MAGAPPALRVQVDQLARQRLGGAPGAELHLLPLLAAELRKRRVGRVGPDVAADLVELVARHEDAVAAAVLELEVVARHTAHGLGVEPGEARDPVVLVYDRVARTEVGERGDRARPGAGPAAPPLGAPAPQQPVLGQDCELEARREEPLAQAGRGEREARVLGGGLAVEEGSRDAGEVVRRALRLAAPRPRDDCAVARAHELLELRLRLAEVPGRGVGTLRAELVRLIAGDGRQPERGAVLELGAHGVGSDV